MAAGLQVKGQFGEPCGGAGVLGLLPGGGVDTEGLPSDPPQ